MYKIKSHVRNILIRAINYALARPRLKYFLIKLLKQFPAVYNRLHRIAHTPTPPPPQEVTPQDQVAVVDITSLTPEAKRIYQKLQELSQARAETNR